MANHLWATNSKAACIISLKISNTVKLAREIKVRIEAYESLNWQELMAIAYR